MYMYLYLIELGIVYISKSRIFFSECTDKSKQSMSYKLYWSNRLSSKVIEDKYLYYNANIVNANMNFDPDDTI